MTRNVKTPPKPPKPPRSPGRWLLQDAMARALDAKLTLAGEIGHRPAQGALHVARPLGGFVLDGVDVAIGILILGCSPRSSLLRKPGQAKNNIDPQEGSHGLAPQEKSGTSPQ